MSKANRTRKYRCNRNGRDFTFYVEKNENPTEWEGWFELPENKGLPIDPDSLVPGMTYVAKTLKELLIDAGVRAMELIK